MKESPTYQEIYETCKKIEEKYENDYANWLKENEERIIEKFLKSEEGFSYYTRNYGEIITSKDQANYLDWQEQLEIDNVSEGFIRALFENEKGTFEEHLKSEYRDPVKSRKMRFVSIISYVGEAWIKYQFRDNGYKVEKIMHEDSKWMRESKIRYILKGHINEEEIIEFIKSHRKGIPDYICLKNGWISFLEIKTNTARVSKNQETVKKLLEDMGYSVDVKRVKVFDFKIHDDDGKITYVPDYTSKNNKMQK